MTKKTGDKNPAGKAKSESSAAEEKQSGNKFTDITSKLPDIPGMVSKIDLDKILGSIKAMINPEEGVESKMKADPNDALGIKIVELSALLQEISKTHAKLSKDFSKVNDLLSGLFEDVEAVRARKTSQHKR